MKQLDNTQISSIHGGAFITTVLEYVGKAYLMEVGKQVVAGTYYTVQQAAQYGKPKPPTSVGFSDFNIPASYVATFGAGVAAGIVSRML